MVDEEYEIMSHSKLNDLKKQVEDLKKGPSKEMHESMNQLKGSMDQMINLFKVAAEEMRTERIEEEGVEKKLGPLMKKLDTIAQQQNELANGMVAIADMIKEHFPKIEHELEGMQRISTEPPRKKPRPMPPPVHKPIPPYPSHEPRPLPPLGPPMRGPGDMPPPPPSFEDEPFPPPRGMPPPFQRGMPPPPPGMGPGPMPPLEPLGPPPEEKPKKKGLLGLFKK